MAVSSFIHPIIHTDTSSSSVAEADAPESASPVEGASAAKEPSTAETISAADAHHEVHGMATRLHRMLGAVHDSNIGIQGMDSTVFAQIKAEIPRPSMFHAGYLKHSDVLKAAKACDAAAEALRGLTLQDFGEFYIANKKDDIVSDFVNAQHSLYKAINSYQDKTGEKSLLLESVKQATQSRISEVLNFTALMKTWDHYHKPFVSTDVTSAIRELSGSMHGAGVVFKELAQSAQDLFGKVDALDGQKGLMSHDEFIRQIADVKVEIASVMAKADAMQGTGARVQDEHGNTIHTIAGNKVTLQGIQEALSRSMDRLTALSSADPKLGVRSALESMTPLVSDTHMQYIADLYGEDGAAYQSVAREYNSAALGLRHDLESGALNAENMDSKLGALRTILNQSVDISHDRRQSLATALNYSVRRYNPSENKIGFHEKAQDTLNFLSTTLGGLSEVQFQDAKAEFAAMADRSHTNPQARGTLIKAAFEHSLDMNFMLEASVRGIPLDQMDLSFTDATVQREHRMDKYMVDRPLSIWHKDVDGASKNVVFTPESTRNMSTMDDIKKFGYAANTRHMQLRVATSRVADMIGCGDVIPTTRIVCHNGEFGSVRAYAAGRMPKNQGVISLGPAIEPAMGEEHVETGRKTFEKATLSLARQLCKLEWADILSGQMHRHDTSYRVGISTDYDVTVQAVDDGINFSTSRLGIQKLSTSVRGQHDYGRLSSGHEGMEEKGGIIDVHGMEKTKKGTQVLSEKLGICSMALPTHIDKETYTKLMDLDAEKYKEILRSMMDETAVDAAASRLEDAKAHAKTLSERGKVVNAWTDMNIIREIKQDAEGKTELFKSLFARDILPSFAHRDSAEHLRLVGFSQ